MKSFFLKIAFSLCLANPLSAQYVDPVAKDVMKRWHKWMETHKIPEGSITIGYNGTIIADTGVKRDADDPSPVASLSKAITAICALAAADASGKSYRTKLSEAMPAALAKHKPKDKRFGDITIGQLIAQTSGITSQYHRKQLEKLRTFGKENKLWQFSRFSKDMLSDKPGKAPHLYSNANYLALGLVIEELTGEPYEAYCTREILDPLGITTARLSETWTVLSSYGGWEISARDYWTFSNHYFGVASGLTRPAGHFLPAGAVGRGRSYGAGIYYRTSNIGMNAWHLGSWRWKGRITDQFGAYFAFYDTGYSVVTNYKHHAWEGAVRDELETLLWDATRR